MTTMNITVAVPLLAMLAFATATDLATRRIPNGLSLGGAFVGVVTQTTLLGASGFAMGVAGWIVCLICFLPLYLSGGMAAGDVKLMAAVGAFLGPLSGFLACLFVLAAGAAIGVGCLMWMRVTRCADGIRGQGDGPGAKIPYAGAIALGTTAVVLQPHLLTMILRKGGLA